MKLTSLFITLLFAANSFAAKTQTPNTKYMSLEAQNAYIADAAKEARRSYWVQGYEDVSSNIQFMTKEGLDEYLNPYHNFESDLDDDEVAQLYKCNYSKTCEPYLIVVSSSYYSGYGEEAHFILLYTKSKKSYELRHSIYAE